MRQIERIYHSKPSQKSLSVCKFLLTPQSKHCTETIDFHALRISWHEFASFHLRQEVSHSDSRRQSPNS